MADLISVFRSAAVENPFGCMNGEADLGACLGCGAVRFGLGCVVTRAAPRRMQGSAPGQCWSSTSNRGPAAKWGQWAVTEMILVDSPIRNSLGHLPGRLPARRRERPTPSRPGESPRRRAAPGQPGRPLHPPNGPRRVRGVDHALSLRVPTTRGADWRRRRPFGVRPQTTFGGPSSPPWPASRRLRGAAKAMSSCQGAPGRRPSRCIPAGGGGSAPCCAGAHRDASARVSALMRRPTRRRARCPDQRPLDVQSATSSPEPPFACPATSRLRAYSRNRRRPTQSSLHVIAMAGATPARTATRKPWSSIAMPVPWPNGPVRTSAPECVISARSVERRRARARYRETGAREHGSGAPQLAEDDLGGGCRVAGHRPVVAPAGWGGPRTVLGGRRPADALGSLGPRRPPGPGGSHRPPCGLGRGPELLALAVQGGSAGRG